MYGCPVAKSNTYGLKKCISLVTTVQLGLQHSGGVLNSSIISSLQVLFTCSSASEHLVCFFFVIMIHRLSLFPNHLFYV